MTDIRQIALDTLKSGAPGLSEQTREVLAGIIARKANLTTTPVAETAGEADPIAYVSRSALKEWLESEHTMADLELRLFEIGDVVPLYAAPVPAQDDDKLRIEKACVIRDRLRQIWEGDTHLVYSGNPPEPSHDEEGPLALLANEAVEALNSIFPVPDDFAALKSTAAQEGGSK